MRACFYCEANCDYRYDYASQNKCCHNSLIKLFANSFISSKPIVEAVNVSALMLNFSEGVNLVANALSSISWISSRVGVWECVMAKTLTLTLLSIAA